jgi:hypothetical protein
VLLAAIALQVIELIKGVNDAAAPVCLQVQVDHCSADVAMAQEFFDGVQIGAGVEQMRSERMSKGVGAKTFILKACLLHCKLYIKLNTAAMHALALLLSFEQINGRTMLVEIFTKRG